MKNANRLSAACAVALLSSFGVVSMAAVPAFPGAQGGGAVSVGGRGGTVYKVSSLADSGPGTLRECVTRRGPRICVFTVGGTINLKSSLYISEPHLTVAGQTARGGGILITSSPELAQAPNNLVSIVAHDVIWQYTRLRNRYFAKCDEAIKEYKVDANGEFILDQYGNKILINKECGGLIGVANGGYTSGYNVILDHNSLSFNNDDAFGIWHGTTTTGLNPLVKNVTVSMNLVGEGLNPHSTGLIVGATNYALASSMYNIDTHHNLFMNTVGRNPLNTSVAASRIVNNIIYNASFARTQVGGGGRYDIINNYYKATKPHLWRPEMRAFTAHDRNPSILLRGNEGWNATSLGDQSLLIGRYPAATGSPGEYMGPIPESWKRTQTLDQLATTNPEMKIPFPITVEPIAKIASATGSIIPTVGASRRLTCSGLWKSNRDAVDQRLVAQYTAGADGANGYDGALPPLPTIANDIPCDDIDNDGMPDAFERVVLGGMTHLPGGDHDNDGYTNIEEYLHGR